MEYLAILKSAYRPAIDNCGRVFNGNRFSYPGLTIDRYNNTLLVQFFDKDCLDNRDKVCDSILQFFSNIFEVDALWYKDRTILKDVKMISKIRESVLYYGNNERFAEVKHNGCVVEVDFVSGQNPGIFADMREVRDRLSSYYFEVDSMLNLFCYTSVFSVHALLNGVKNAVNVDTSKQVLERSRINYRKNSLGVDNRDFIHNDSGLYLKKLVKYDRKFDIVIYDPPTFSRNKKFYFSVKNDYKKQLNLISQVSNRYVLSAINSYSVSRQEYLDYHPKNWEMLFFMNEASDFYDSSDPYLKCALWQIS
ncbi:MAG: class I SAM-dependent methyltransferase [Spirochaetes bacterium]|nr:class I SAM-dependent methyltransferase [Spirochaetota bacterium]MBN2770485.1 class I SAM-dependent methyltransferase [Spirochaetota bacterium]